MEAHDDLRLERKASAKWTSPEGQGCRFREEKTGQIESAVDCDGTM